MELLEEIIYIKDNAIVVIFTFLLMLWLFIIPFILLRIQINK